MFCSTQAQLSQKVFLVKLGLLLVGLVVGSPGLLGHGARSRQTRVIRFGRRPEDHEVMPRLQMVLGGIGAVLFVAFVVSAPKLMSDNARSHQDAVRTSYTTVPSCGTGLSFPAHIVVGRAIKGAFVLHSSVHGPLCVFHSTIFELTRFDTLSPPMFSLPLLFAGFNSGA
jgi:hypothetical protein